MSHRKRQRPASPSPGLLSDSLGLCVDRGSRRLRLSQRHCRNGRNDVKPGRDTTARPRFPQATR